MDRWRGKVALVTGASGGIGHSLAETLARNGMRVVACARRAEEIEKLQKQLPEGSNDLTAIKCDLVKEEDILAMFKQIEQQFGHVDVLVNNAGTAFLDPLSEGKTSEWQQMLDLNVLAVCICTREALRLMKKDNIDDGHIVNINSTSGHALGAPPPIRFFEGTKHMLTALTKALNAELRQQKSQIRVTNLSPGLVTTPITELHADTLPPIKALESIDISHALLYILGVPPHVNIRELIIAPTEQSW
ncbi:hypothetical protein RvY_16884 [Ramazzottius varieornatus]|uniref:Dehydrogenase/reductase SDR family member 11 n=1 Tax=Ramazzottius varieornatus TaxID=947166 RepID=A0A1D1W024_RAMVA|nr:hypothetical protein RvY_16884 [Ramazzottius varieornatus]